MRRYNSRYRWHFIWYHFQSKCCQSSVASFTILNDPLKIFGTQTFHFNIQVPSLSGKGQKLCQRPVTYHYWTTQTTSLASQMGCHIRSADLTYNAVCFIYYCDFFCTGNEMIFFCCIWVCTITWSLGSWAKSR